MVEAHSKQRLKRMESEPDIWEKKTRREGFRRHEAKILMKSRVMQTCPGAHLVQPGDRAISVVDGRAEPAAAQVGAQRAAPGSLGLRTDRRQEAFHGCASLPAVGEQKRARQLPCPSSYVDVWKASAGPRHELFVERAGLLLLAHASVRPVRCAGWP